MRGRGWMGEGGGARADGVGGGEGGGGAKLLYRYGARPDARGGKRGEVGGAGGAGGPVVSVVTPVWNTAGEVLRETAASVFGQSLWAGGGVEWVIVNDGSTEAGTLRVLDELGERAGVTVVDHGGNRGLPASRNTGFANARAGLVFMLDSDDLLEPTALEKCAWYLATHPEDSFVKGWSVGFGGQQYLWKDGFERAERFLERNRVDANAMVRASVHRLVGGFDESLRTGPEDWDFWLRCANAGRWGGTIPEFLDWYRRREKERTTAGWNKVDREARRQWFVGEAARRYPALFATGSEREGSAEGAGGGIGARVGERLPRAQSEEEARENAATRARLRGMRVGEGGGATQRVLVVVEQVDVSAGALERGAGVDLSRLDELVGAGFGVTVVATGEPAQPGPRLAADAPGAFSYHVDLAEVSRRTADVFVARNYVKDGDVGAFVEYLARSRGVERVIRGSDDESGVRVVVEEGAGERAGAVGRK